MKKSFWGIALAGALAGAANGLFGGGGGAGISIVPIAFLCVNNGNVRVVPMVSTPDTLNQAVNMIPDVVDRIGGFFQKDKTAD